MGDDTKVVIGHVIYNEDLESYTRPKKRVQADTTGWRKATNEMMMYVLGGYKDERNSLANRKVRESNRAL